MPSRLKRDDKSRWLTWYAIILRTRTPSLTTPIEILLLLKDNSCSFIFSGLFDVDEPTTSAQQQPDIGLTKCLLNSYGNTM